MLIALRNITRKLWASSVHLIRSFKRRAFKYGVINIRVLSKKGCEIDDAIVYIHGDRKSIIRSVAPYSFRVKPGRYTVRVVYMENIIEKDVEVKEGEVVKKEFRFPGGVLECKAYEGANEVGATVKIINMETGELVAERVTPFTIHLETGKYILRATYTPVK